MFDIQEKFQFRTEYSFEQVKERFLALNAEEYIDSFGANNFYIEGFDPKAKVECPILCKVYTEKEGCILHFTIGDKDFWAKKIQILPEEPEAFVFKTIFGLAFWAMISVYKPIIFTLGILVALGFYSVNNVYPRKTYNYYHEICLRYKEAMLKLFRHTSLVDKKVKDLIDEIGT